MNIKRFCILLALGMALAATTALASTTYDVYTTYNTTSATAGPFQYGYVNWSDGGTGQVQIDANTYAYNSMTSYVASFEDGRPGSQWCWDSTYKSRDGEPCPSIDQYTGTSNYWVFPGQSVIITSGNKFSSDTSGKAPVLRFTAQIAGNYAYTGALTNLFENTKYQLVLVGANNSRTLLASSTNPMAQNEVATLSGSVAMGAGDSLDLIWNQYLDQQLLYGKLGLQITQNDVPEPGSLMALVAGLASLGGLVIRRRK